MQGHGRAAKPSIFDQPPGVDRLFGRPQVRAHLIQQLLRLRAFDAGDVVLVLQQHAKRIGDGRGIERDCVELGERRRR